jgi:hypothetical protein
MMSKLSQDQEKQIFLYLHIYVRETWSKSYELQRQRCKILHLHEQPMYSILKTKMFSSTLKNALAYYNTGAVVVNSKVLGLATEMNLYVVGGPQAAVVNTGLSTSVYLQVINLFRDPGMK